MGDSPQKPSSISFIYPICSSSSSSFNLCLITGSPKKYNLPTAPSCHTCKRSDAREDRLGLAQGGGTHASDRRRWDERHAEDASYEYCRYHAKDFEDTPPRTGRTGAPASKHAA